MVARWIIDRVKQKKNEIKSQNIFPFIAMMVGMATESFMEDSRIFSSIEKGVRTPEHNGKSQPWEEHF